MHAHDRTILASLGFADLDKKNPEHDSVCRYLTTRDVTLRIGKVVAPPPRHRPGAIFKDSLPRSVIHSERDNLPVIVECEYVGSDEPFTSGETEVHLTKGEGRYCATVGFLDVVLHFRSRSRFVLTHEEIDGAMVEVPRQEFVYECDKTRSLFIEVKIAQISVGDVLRQLNLYKTYFRPQHAFDLSALLVAPWAVTQSEGEELRKAGFAFVQIGDDYKKWAEEDATRIATPSLVL